MCVVRMVCVCAMSYCGQTSSREINKLKYVFDLYDLLFFELVVVKSINYCTLYIFEKMRQVSQTKAWPSGGEGLMPSHRPKFESLYSHL